MKSPTWITFGLTFVLAIANVSRVALDQPARDLAVSDARKVQAIVESTTVTRVKEIQELSQALGQKTGER